MIADRAGPPPDMVKRAMRLGGQAGAGATGFYLLGLAIWSAVETTLTLHLRGLLAPDRAFVPELLERFVFACMGALLVCGPGLLTPAIFLGVMTGCVIAECLQRLWAVMTLRSAWLVGSLVCLLAVFLISTVVFMIFLLPYAPRVLDSSFLSFCRLMFGIPCLIYLSLGGWLSAQFYSRMKRLSR
jgi:hypothetical protein